MDGHKALMYARSRHQDSDYGRMDRQQIVISAIGKKLLKERPPRPAAEAAQDRQGQPLDEPQDGDLPDLAQLAEQTDLKGMQQCGSSRRRTREYLDRASITRIRSVVKHVFDKAKPLATPAPFVPPTAIAPPPGY